MININGVELSSTNIIGMATALVVVAVYGYLRYYFETNRILDPIVRAVGLKRYKQYKNVVDRVKTKLHIGSFEEVESLAKLSEIEKFVTLFEVYYVNESMGIFVFHPQGVLIPEFPNQLKLIGMDAEADRCEKILSEILPDGIILDNEKKYRYFSEKYVDMDKAFETLNDRFRGVLSGRFDLGEGRKKWVEIWTKVIEYVESSNNES